MQGISQIQVGVDAVQDRLILRIATAANEEIRVFVTRRFLREIWPPLAQACQILNPPSAAAAGEKAVAGGSQGSFEESFSVDNPIYPLGSTPLLASEMVLEPIEPGGCRMTLREARERSFSFNLDGDLAQAICAMLRAGADKAGWDLKLDYAATQATTAPASTPVQTLH